ncbi:4-(cytidine 5'-diphospho)-2-C-methyl-D-erythritol kinase [Campylobacter hyointestinalis]|uniref:4-(cytidine 5'-diphospho)-2-C-methyl-D-erythritol kinase n=1 Tax=Campylobacter hyointestinalis TaxID=198 RepID=UPI002554E39E|nr:4-(cytidine 5'-diphospho)-2-C-methyl-D-erythritol kinase [Campylobacter hyointestinalis]MDL2346679.1 4-(cytidine 5'-diphospho)-2-C-methyl-D-erythritol kinase [Campylobacter hyointestinalis]MDL2348710.1 4-(cytidine 5'-diphospho)-2-C-methyl-D-erythritol kinase [Campylobacter hyointestinalis]MDL2350165.1 4-(cytidine 5'-diphospho)-2-C-methyl-D-erythritol kinase [Campylobacter hyointestinalis]MDM1026286.1 4-(cytidine 5'-diphospho)-2-C-methyl-D-erythritol kinase [Campylobacter hyointestinalis]MDM
MRSYAKLNIFLKIIGTRGDYHEIISRFVLFEELYDEINFIKKTTDEFIKDDYIPENIIKKARISLENLGFKNELDEFFTTHQVELIKKIPCGGGLGGGSSNAATFLNLANEELNLKIPKEKLMKISKNIGADVAFFVSEFKSANVSGVGEIVENFYDDVPNLGIITSDIFCSTPKVFREFRQNFFKFDINLAKNLEQLSSNEILHLYQNYELNDLLRPCLKLYPNLIVKQNEFLSGSGSTKFILK